MNTRELRKIQRFLTEVRDQEGDMSVQRLQVLLEVVLTGELDQTSLVKKVKLNRSATSKNIASWTALTATKAKGPAYIESQPDPMNLKTRVLKPTAKGTKAVEKLCEAANL